MKVAVPLTFALALSAATSVAATAAVDDKSELLRPGSLRKLVDSGQTEVGGSGSARDDQGVKRQVAQACWYGYWRRC
jgi:hypothetical protein